VKVRILSSTGVFYDKLQLKLIVLEKPFLVAEKPNLENIDKT